MDTLKKALAPAKLGELELRNRFIKAATFEGLTPQGDPTEQLIRFHTDLAKGGIGMTTVGQCNVSADARNLDNQMYFRREIIPGLRELTSSVHSHGARICAQLTHCGFFKQNKPIDRKRVLTSSFHFNKLGAPYGRPFAYAMTKADIADVIRDHVRTAEIAREAGFDAIELQMAHGYFLGQFISANINKRHDEYGGPLAQRMRLPMEIIKAIKGALGDRFPVLAKINLDDACRGGITIEGAVEVGRHLEDAGIDALVTSGGRSPGNTAFLFRGDTPMPKMIELQTNPLSKAFLKLFGHLQYVPVPYKELYFLDMARELRAAVSCPIVYLGGVSTVKSVQRLMEEGFDFIGMGRALIKDPQLVNNLQRDPKYRNHCTHCNQCVALVYSPSGVHCVLNHDQRSA